jgi:hypothetical protein
MLAKVDEKRKKLLSKNFARSRASLLGFCTYNHYGTELWCVAPREKLFLVVFFFSLNHQMEM